MSPSTPPNTTLARKAEEARQVRDGDPPSGAVKVKVTGGAVAVGGEVHESGATFTAPEEAVRDALARGLVEKAKAKAK